MLFLVNNHKEFSIHMIVTRGRAKKVKNKMREEFWLETEKRQDPNEPLDIEMMFYKASLHIHHIFVSFPELSGSWTGQVFGLTHTDIFLCSLSILMY